jgi:hypothetical protein
MTFSEDLTIEGDHVVNVECKLSNFIGVPPARTSFTVTAKDPCHDAFFTFTDNVFKALPSLSLEYTLGQVEKQLVWDDQEVALSVTSLSCGPYKWTIRDSTG